MLRMHPDGVIACQHESLILTTQCEIQKAAPVND
jgi:hypothetical protein